MKLVQRSIAMLLVVVLAFSLVDWTMGNSATAYADNTPTWGSTSVGETPDELLTMGEWQYWVEDGQAIVAGYLDEGVTNLQIPARLGGYPVTGIGEKAFSENTSLNFIQIPTNVTRIADNAFKGLADLTISAYHGAYALLYAGQKNIQSSTIQSPGIEFAPGVLDLSGLPENTYSGLNDSGVSFSAGEATFLAVGQVLFFPRSASYPAGLARRVSGLVLSGNSIQISFSLPNWEDCFIRVYGEEAVSLDWEHAEVYEGFELVDEVYSSESKNVSFKHKFKIEYGPLSGSVTLNIGKANVKYDLSAVDVVLGKAKIDVSIPIDTTLEVSCEKEFKPEPLTFARVPIEGAGAISGEVKLQWKTSIKGEISVEATYHSVINLSYQNFKIKPNINSWKDEPIVRKLKATASTGPDLNLALKVGVGDLSVTILELSVGAALVIEGTAKPIPIASGTESLHTCIDATVKIEAKLTLKMGIVKIVGHECEFYEKLEWILGKWVLASGHFDDSRYSGKNDNSCNLKNRKVTVTNEGKDSATVANVNSLIPSPTTPYKSGHTFNGWYVNAQASGLFGSDYKFDFSRDVMPYCGPDGTLYIYAKFNPIPVTSVKLNKSSATIYTNDKKGVQLEQTVAPANAANTSVKWTSSNTKVAKVNSNGKVTPVAAGTATITCASVSNPDKKATFKITVKQYVDKISLSASKDEIFEGETLQINASVSPSDSSDKGLTWSSSNTSIATVDTSGKVTGVKSGTVTITATAKDRGTVSGKYSVDILLPVTNITLDKSSAVIYTNNTNGLQLNPTLTPSGASLSSVSWESSNAAIATVSKAGVVKPVAPGTVTITCRSKSNSSVTAVCTITVKQYVESVAINREIASIAADETLQLNTVVLPNNATDKSLVWTSSDTSVATVSNSGLVTGVGGGTAVITATANDGSGKKDSFKIVVVELPTSTPSVPVSGITTGSSSMTVYTVNKTAQISASVSPSNADSSIIWASSNESVATVDNTGKITMIRGGTTILTGRSVSDPHKYVNINLRVVQSVESITITGNNQIEKIGDSTVLTAVVGPDIAENKAVSWSWTTVNGGQVQIDQNGKVTAVANGIVKITATAKDGSGVSGNFNLKVGKDPVPVETITLDITEISKYTNEKEGVVLTPTVLPDYADDLSVIWSSSDEQVATVDKNGKISFTAPGHTTITCRSVMTPSVTATCEVTVKQYVEQIVLDSNSYSLLPGGTAQLTAAVYPSNASNKSLTWSSSDTSIATVSQNGMVTAVGYGDVTITATAKDGSGAESTYSLKVEKELQLQVSVVNDTVFTQGDEKCDIAYVSLTNASVQRMAEAGNTLSWSMTKKSGSGDTALSVVDTTVNTNGTTHATSAALLSGGSYPTAGTEVYTVTCKAGQFEESVDITVTVDGGEYAAGVKLTDSNVGSNTITMNMGADTLVPVSPYASDGKAIPDGMAISIIGDSYYTESAVESMSSDGLLVSFAESGVYTATVRYVKGNLAYEVAATFQVADENGIVRLRVEDVALSDNIIHLIEGKTSQLTATVSPSDAYNNTLTWSSSDTKVATVTADGVVKGITSGTAVITCTANDGSGVSASCTVIVESYLQLDENELAYTVYTGGVDHADLDTINVTIDSQERLVEDNLNVTWTIERLSGTSTELGISEFISTREDGVAVSGELIKLLRINGAGTDEYCVVCAAGDYTDSCIIRVTAKSATLPNTVTLNTSTYEGTVGNLFTADLSYTLSPSGAALPKDVNIAIDGGNAFKNALSSLYNYEEPEKLIFEKAGSYTAYVTFTGTNYSYRCPVTIEVANEDGVVPPTINEVVVSEDELMLVTGDTHTLSVSTEPANASYSKVTWSSTNTAVATVSSTGKVTAIGPGYASIVASIPESDYEGSCLVCVEEGINFRENEVERTVFVDGETRMTLDRLMLTDNTSVRLGGAPEWTLKRVSGISLTLRAKPVETVNSQGQTLYGCDLMLYSVSKEGDTVYELTCSNGTSSMTATITVHAVNRERLLPASISLDQTIFTADIGELIVAQPVVTAYPSGSRLPNGIVVSCEGDTQYQQALNAEDTFVSQSLSTFSFSKAGTYRVNMVYSYSNMKYVVPVTFRIRDANGEVPVQVSGMTLSEKSLYMMSGDTETLDAVFTPADATNQNVSWKSSNTSVATVNASGQVHAVANGTATITCTPADTSCPAVSCTVIVEDYLAVTNGTTSRTLFLQGKAENSVGYAALTEGTKRRLEADGLKPVWTISTEQVTHTSLVLREEEDGSSVYVETEALLGRGTDTFIVSCTAGSHSWSQSYTVTVDDLGATAPQSVSIIKTAVSAAVNQAVTIDFTPVITPSGASMPSNMNSVGYVGIGSFYDALDESVFAENGNQVTVAFTKPGQYLLTKTYTLRNLQYVTACTITVGGEQSGRGVLSATETNYVVYSGGKSGSVSTVSITDGMLYELWGSNISWNVERISGNSMNVALKENGSSVDVFVASVFKNGTDVWRVSCSFGGMTESVDITLTADDPRSDLPESIAIPNNKVTGTIGNVITVPLGVICSPSGTMLPDQGDDFWSFSFDRAGEERSNHSFENGMLTVDFTMSGYYTGILRYKSGNVSYSTPVYFVIQDEEQEVRKPDLKLYALNTFDTVYPEGETGVAIGQMVMSDGLTTYSTGNAVAYMNNASAVWKVTKTGSAAALSLRKVSDNVYDLILDSVSGSGDVSYTVKCTVDGKTYSVNKTLHVAGPSEPRPDATLRHTSYQTAVGEELRIDSRMYSRENGEILQSSTTFNPAAVLAAVGYEVEEHSDDWRMTFYSEGTFNASVSAMVSNLAVDVPVVIVVGEKGSESRKSLLKLPAALTEIDAEAFAGISANVIDLRGTKIKTIGASAFKYSVDISEVYLPDSVTTIADDAFYGCLNATFYCSPGSYAATWAAAHQFPVVNP